jgi:hypothetical protein
MSKRDDEHSSLSDIEIRVRAAFYSTFGDIMPTDMIVDLLG